MGFFPIDEKQPVLTQKVPLLLGKLPLFSTWLPREISVVSLPSVGKPSNSLFSRSKTVRMRLLPKNGHHKTGNSSTTFYDGSAASDGMLEQNALIWYCVLLPASICFGVPLGVQWYLS
jgi:hypothetical protein